MDQCSGISILNLIHNSTIIDYLKCDILDYSCTTKSYKIWLISYIYFNKRKIIHNYNSPDFSRRCSVNDLILERMGKASWSKWKIMWKLHLRFWDTSHCFSTDHIKLFSPLTLSGVTERGGVMCTNLKLKSFSIEWKKCNHAL